MRAIYPRFDGTLTCKRGWSVVYLILKRGCNSFPGAAYVIESAKMANSRFESMNEEEIAHLFDDKNSKNTKKNRKRQVVCFLKRLLARKESKVLQQQRNWQLFCQNTTSPLKVLKIFWMSNKTIIEWDWVWDVKNCEEGVWGPPSKKYEKLQMQQMKIWPKTGSVSTITTTSKMISNFDADHDPYCIRFKCFQGTKHFIQVNNHESKWFET